MKLTSIKQIRSDFKAGKLSKEKRDELISDKRAEMAINKEKRKFAEINKPLPFTKISKMEVSAEERADLIQARKDKLAEKRESRHGPVRMTYTKQMKDEFKMPLEARTYLIKFKWHTAAHTDSIGRKVKAANFEGRGWSTPINVPTLKNLYKSLKVKNMDESTFRELVSANFPDLSRFNGSHVKSSSDDEDAQITISSLERMDEKPKDFNIIRQRIKTGGIIQPTLGSYGGKYAQYGAICKPEFYREDSCMMSLFLETWKHRLIKKKYQSDLNFDRLYEIATGEKLTDELGGVSLLEASKWCDRFQIQMTAIDARGKVVYTYSAETLDKKIKNGNTWRIMVTNDHVWQISEEYAKEIDQLKSHFSETQQSVIKKRFECELPTADEKPVNKYKPQNKDKDGKVIVEKNNHSEFKISEMYAQPMEPSDEENGMASTVDDVIKTNYLSYSTHDVESLAQSLYKAGFIPGNIFMSNIGTIERFNVFMERTIDLDESKIKKFVSVKIQKATIYEMKDTGNSVVDDAANLQQHNLFQSHLYELRTSVMPGYAMSNYSSSLLQCFNEYGRGPINGYCGGGKEGEENYVEFDITRFYTSCMSEINYVPVFCKLDCVCAVKSKPEKLDAYSFYVIKVAKYNLDFVLFNSTTDFVSGETLIYADSLNIPYEIVGVCKPHTIIETDNITAIKKVYDDVNLNDANKKSICNIVYGLGNKKYNKKIKGEIYKNKRQGESEYSPRIREFDDAFISVKIGRANLAQGYLSVGRIILDKSRIALHKIYSVIKPLVKAIRTDAFFVHPDDKKKATDLLVKAKILNSLHGKTMFQRIGSLKHGTEATKTFTQPLKLYETEKYVPMAAPTQKEIKIDEEKTMINNPDRWTEVDALMQDKPSIHMQATTPGSGKSYLLEEWIKRTKQVESALIVCPWNALCSDMRKKGFNAITLHELCGKIGNGDSEKAEEGKKNPYKMEGITHVHFDEICLYTPSQFNWISNWLKQQKDAKRIITRSSTGDPKQLAAIGCNFHYDSVEWYQQAISQLFPRVVTLKIPKRVADPKQRALMAEMCKELADETKPIETILKEAKLKFVKFDDLTASDMDSPHITAMRATSCKVDNLALSLKKIKTTDYEVGEELIGICSYLCKGKKRISSSDSYYVDVINKKDSKMILTASDGSVRELDLKKVPSVLRRPFSRTGHGTQGMSLGNKIYIHDLNTYLADYRWFRTAISRCSTLDIVIVTGSQMNDFDYDGVKRRIAGHQAADKAKGFEWNKKNYVNADWVKERLLKQRYQCYHQECRKALDSEFSIDRIQNSISHITSNCAMSCYRCQDRSTHRK